MIPAPPEIEIIGSSQSTNSELAAVAASRRHGYTIMARIQTAGRGQRGNTWESEPYANITLSTLLRPHDLEARDQFALSEAVSLGITDTLARYGIDARIKWPNDIYAGDMKICGILIENSLTGKYIERSIAGIGLNVNQMAWTGSAPNPISMAMVTGRTFDVDNIAETLVSDILQRVAGCETRRHELHARYMTLLWRNSGLHPYMDSATGQRFEAAITDIAPTGHITLTLADGTSRTYAFKEVSAVL